MRSASMVRNAALLAAVLLALTNRAPALVSADPDAGADVFDTYCGDCHSVRPTGRNRKGPPLQGVIGRRAGTMPGFRYSSAMASSGITWNASNLSAYLADPRGVVPGGKMKDKLTKASDRDNVIAYLASARAATRCGARVASIESSGAAWPRGCVQSVEFVRKRAGNP